MALHHPDKEQYPNWVIDTGNHFFHKALTIAQRMKPDPWNLAIIRGFIDALEWEYLKKRRILDVASDNE